MIEIKVADLVNSVGVLQKLSNMSLKARLAWKVSRLLKAADDEIQEFNKTRIEVVKKYGIKDENGELVLDDAGNCKIQDEYINTFTQEMNELTSDTIEINANPIGIDEIEELSFTPGEMAQLEPFIAIE